MTSTLQERILRLYAEDKIDAAAIWKAVDLGFLKITDAPVPEPQTHKNAATLRTQAANAIDANKTFLAISAPSNAQVLAQTKALTRQVNAVIRLVIGSLEGTD